MLIQENQLETGVWYNASMFDAHVLRQLLPKGTSIYVIMDEDIDFSDDISQYSLEELEKGTSIDSVDHIECTNGVAEVYVSSDAMNHYYWFKIA